MPDEKKPLSRAGRTAARNKVRARVAREQRLKDQVQNWCNPLKNAVDANDRKVQEMSREFNAKEVDLRIATQTAKDTVTNFEKHLEKLIKDEVNAAVTRRLHQDETGLSALHRQFSTLSGDLSLLKDKVLESHEKNKLAISALQDSAAKAHKDIEHNAVKLADARSILDKVAADVDTYCRNDEQQKAYILRLEMLCKDMEGRVWPWRPNMDRSKSPPRYEDEMVAVPQYNAPGEKNEWLPWPPNGPVKPDKTLTRTASPARSPPASVQPTPPSSRPSSARYRGREPANSKLGFSRADSNPVGSACAVAKGARPSSAQSHRSYASSVPVA